MLRLFAWLLTAFLILLAALVGIAVKAIDETPLVPLGEAPSAAAITRGRELVRRNDPRKLRRNETREVRLDAADLETVLNLASTRGLKGNASLALYEGGAEIRYSTRVPSTPFGRFLNITANLSADGGPEVALEQIHLGTLPLPLVLFRPLFEQYLKRTDLQADLTLLKQSISRLAITPEEVRVTYVWQPEILDSARALALPPAQREALAQAHQRLVQQMDSVGLRRSVPLASVLGPLLADAGNSGSPAERAARYRDILFVAAMQLSGKNIALLIPEARQWPRPRPLTLTLRGREDLAQHFTISAALAAWSGEALASAIGLEKELRDAQGGSGFSFIDLTADRSGTRLGELAVHNPERLAAALAAGLGDTALLPPIDGLPEFMQKDEFERRFGGVGAPAYREMSDEIDRRIAALALFR